MKRSLKIAMLSCLFTWGMFSLTYASDRTTEKTREAVEEASPDDWYTLAANAERCFKKNVNLKEAAEWLDASLAIIETPYNLSLNGDYYRMNRLPEQAMQYYVKALNAITNNPETSISIASVQKKIAEITHIGG